MHNDANSEVEPAQEKRMLRLLFEVPTDGLRDLVELLAPLKHIAYRSDLWLTQRDEGSSRSSGDNGAVGESASSVEQQA